MKRIITLLLTLVMVLSLAMPAQAAGKTKASTMRLMETEGTATVENAIGRKMTIKDKMQLYSGYKVSTKAASYAYISLDNSKSVKLDASSAVKVNQSGKKLELDVTAGKLMFNVPVSLKSDESLTIRTSTMVTGIRGTAGWVDSMNRYTTRIGVLEGVVTVQSVDPDTGAARSVTITGGQIATIIHHERANDIAQQLIDDGVIVEENIIAELTKTGQIVEGIQESDVPGFVAGEVASDSDLQQRMEEESPLNVDEIMEGAEDRKKQEEKAAEEKELEIQAALEELGAEDLGLPFGGTVIERVEIFTPAPGGLNDPETADVQSALESVGIAAITNPGSDFDITALRMDAGDVLYVIGGTLN
ncbi:MAG: FecR domain-containing protein, partial [Oscillospiraceae bacterium]|nr:FecR domain-containing protein [Oscillospiraceae bacterium]